MKAIDKFILHVVHNLFPLNEYSEKEINKALKNEPLYGNLGSFVGQDWGRVPNILIKEADNQDDLMEFIATGKPNYVGTGGPTN